MLDHTHQQFALQEIGHLCASMRENFAQMLDGIRNLYCAPHVVRNTHVQYSVNDGCWYCSEIEFSGDGIMETHLVGKGDTPCAACDDFDRQWHGYPKPEPAASSPSPSPNAPG